MKNETANHTLNFLRNRIKLIPRAILYNLNTLYGYLPNDIVYVQTMDDDGCVWIEMNYPKYNPVFLYEPFPVKLSLYCKHVDFHIEAEGEAQFHGAVADQNDRVLLKVIPFSISVTEFGITKHHGLERLQHSIDFIRDKINYLIPLKKENPYISE